MRGRYTIISLLLMSLSATAWAVAARDAAMPLIWLAFLVVFILVNQPREIPFFFRRLLKTAALLFAVSLLQIIFRRTGRPLVSISGIVLVFSDGFREALLLWIRFMILFVLARIMAGTTVFQFLLLTDKLRIPLNFGLLLLMTVKLLPFIFTEARSIVWFFRFRGLSFRKLALREKGAAVRQLAYAILMRSVEYVFNSALTLELRGYGRPHTGRIPASIPLSGNDLCLLLLIAAVNAAGLLIY